MSKLPDRLRRQSTCKSRAISVRDDKQIESEMALDDNASVISGKLIRRLHERANRMQIN
jgi:hypothetical protein